jgi:hypothetical protein
MQFAKEFHFTPVVQLLQSGLRVVMSGAARVSPRSWARAPSIAFAAPKRVVAAAAFAPVASRDFTRSGNPSVNSADRTMLATRAAVHAPRVGVTGTRRGRSVETRATAVTARAGAFAAPLRFSADARRKDSSRGA